MADWIGVFILFSLFAGVVIGLKLLSKPKSRTQKEFEEDLAKSSSVLGNVMFGIHKMLSPNQAKAKEVRMEKSRVKMGK